MKLNDKVVQRDINSIGYFLKEKGDIERWSSWEDRKEAIINEFPELEKALRDFAASTRILDIVTEDILSRVDDYEDN